MNAAWTFEDGPDHDPSRRLGRVDASDEMEMAHMGSFGGGMPPNYFNTYHSMSAGFQGHAQFHFQPRPYAFHHHGVAPPPGNSRAALLAQHHKLVHGKESKPRLDKDQVEKLESQFQANSKPTSQLKRQLATQMNVALPRINVVIWCPVHIPPSDRKSVV